MSNWFLMLLWVNVLERRRIWGGSWKRWQEFTGKTRKEILFYGEDTAGVMVSRWRNLNVFGILEVVGNAKLIWKGSDFCSLNNWLNRKVIKCNKEGKRRVNLVGKIVFNKIEFVVVKCQTSIFGNMQWVLFESNPIRLTQRDFREKSYFSLLRL